MGGLGGCASVVESQVTAFHTLPGSLAGQSYAFIPSPDQTSSLEYRTYEALVRQRLDARGLREAERGKAELAISLAYEIDDGKTVVSSYPIIGQTGILSSQHQMSVDRSRPGVTEYVTHSSYTPAYGVVGTGVASDVIFTRRLELSVFDRPALDRGDARKLYEGRAVSEGSSGELNEVMSYMVEALFQDFPGPSGVTRTVTLSTEKR